MRRLSANVFALLATYLLPVRPIFAQRNAQRRTALGPTSLAILAEKVRYFPYPTLQPNLPWPANSRPNEPADNLRILALYFVVNGRAKLLNPNIDIIRFIPWNNIQKLFNPAIHSMLTARPFF